MAIYHLNSKVISRSSGGSAANALAYETGSSLERIDGEQVDFSRKEVERSEVIGTPDNLQALADKMELSENRRNSTVGRRMTIALPAELSKEERWNCAEKLGQFMNSEYGLAVVVSMHAPDKGGNQKNHHAHLTMSDRRVDAQGNFGKKARELTERKGGRAKMELEKIRSSWAGICNEALERADVPERIDHRSYKEQGIDAKATQHLGKSKTEITRKSKYVVTDEITNEITRSRTSTALKNKIKKTNVHEQERAGSGPGSEPKTPGRKHVPGTPAYNLQEGVGGIQKVVEVLRDGIERLQDIERRLTGRIQQLRESSRGVKRKHDLSLNGQQRDTGRQQESAQGSRVKKSQGIER